MLCPPFLHSLKCTAAEISALFLAIRRAPLTSGLHVLQAIQNHPPALEQYKVKLVQSGKMTEEEIQKMQDQVMSILNDEFNKSKDYIPKTRDWLAAYWSGFKGPEQLSRIRNTGYTIMTLAFDEIVEVCENKMLKIGSIDQYL